MGTDIHLQVQGRIAGRVTVANRNNPPEKFQLVPLSQWEYVRTRPFPTYRQDGYDYNTDPTGRNYNLFGFLADVRNGTGLAGVKTGEPVEPLFPLRGLPAGVNPDYVPGEMPDAWGLKDKCDARFEGSDRGKYLKCQSVYEMYKRGTTDGEKDAAYRALAKLAGVELPAAGEEFVAGDDWLGDHSFTHATLKELREAPWDSTVTSQGVVNEDGFREWREDGMPQSWCGWTGGQGIYTHTNPDTYEAALEALAVGDVSLIDVGPTGTDFFGRVKPETIKPTEASQVKSLNCVVTWTWQPLVDCCFRRWIDSDIMNKIAEDYGGPENVRVLMGFDS